MKRFALFLAVVMFACSCFAGSPSLKSDSPSLKSDAQTIVPNQMVQITVDGLTLDVAKKSATTVFPRENVTFFPAATWDGSPVIFFSAQTPGKYLVGIYSPNKDGTVTKLETVLEVKVAVPNPPDPGPGPLPVPGKIWTIVVEDTLKRTPQIEAVEQALRKYAVEKQENRWKRLDPNSQNEEDRVPEAYARFIKAASSVAVDRPVLFIVDIDGKILLSCALPETADAAVALARKYGG